MPATDWDALVSQVHSARRFSGLLAEKLADLTSLEIDLVGVRAALARLQRELRKEQPDMTIVGALWTTAIVRYMRCFVKGARTRLDAKLLFSPHGADCLDFHEFILHTRDKHVSHAVNEQESVAIGVHFDESGNVTALTEFNMAMLVYQSPLLRRLGWLTRICLRWCRKQKPPIRLGVRQEIERLAPADRLALPFLRVEVPVSTTESLQRRRKRLSKH